MVLASFTASNDGDKYVDLVVISGILIFPQVRKLQTGVKAGLMTVREADKQGYPLLLKIVMTAVMVVGFHSKR